MQRRRGGGEAGVWIGRGEGRLVLWPSVRRSVPVCLCLSMVFVLAAGLPAGSREVSFVRAEGGFQAASDRGPDNLAGPLLGGESFSLSAGAARLAVGVCCRWRRLLAGGVSGCSSCCCWLAWLFFVGFAGRKVAGRSFGAP